MKAKVKIFTLTDIVRYCERIVERDQIVTGIAIQREARIEGYSMSLGMAKRYAWTMHDSTLIRKHKTILKWANFSRTTSFTHWKR